MDIDDTAPWARATIQRYTDIARRALVAYYRKPRSVKRLHVARRDLARLSTTLDDLGAMAALDAGFAEQIHALHRRAGKVRDGDVLLRRLKTYRKLARGAECVQLARVRRALRARRKRARRKLRRLIRPSVAIMKSALSPAAAPSATPLKAVRALLQHRIEDCLARQSAFDAGDDDVLHAFRLSCKQLHYVIERSSTDLPELEPLAKLLSNLTDALGIAHDCVALRERARECNAPLVGLRAQHDRDVHVRLARRQWREAAQHLHTTGP